MLLEKTRLVNLMQHQEGKYFDKLRKDISFAEKKMASEVENFCATVSVKGTC